MLETILLAIIVAKVKKYAIKPLFKSWPIYLVLAIELVYVVIQISIFRGYYGLLKYTNILETIYLCSYLALIIQYKQYIGAIAGSGCIVMGTLLNHMAIAANQGKMPVFPTLSYLTGYVKPEAFIKVNDIHILGDANTRLKFLADVFDLGYSIVSIGDIFIRAFIFIIVFSSIRHLNREGIVTIKDK
jgi:hypothetical protein